MQSDGPAAKTFGGVLRLTRRWVAAMGLSIGAAFVAAGCALFSESSSFLIRVDNVTVVGEAIAGGEMTIRFQGYVGNSGCSRLVRIVKNVTALSLEIGFEGEEIGGYCTTMPVQLDHNEVVRLPGSGTFQIRVRQPHGECLTQSVLVQ